MSEPLDTSPPRSFPQCPPHWWGAISVPQTEEPTGRRWRIGSLTLVVQHARGDLLLSILRNDDPHDATLESGSAVEGEALAALVAPGKTVRVAFQPPLDGSLSLAVALADRPLVSRPETPLSIPPGEEVHFYVSNPLWIQVVQERLGTLLDVPLFPPSESWFGPDRVRGELCYASRTHPRFHLDNLPSLVQRAVTPVQVSNQGSDALLLERLKLPVPNLELFEGDDHRLWTTPVELQRGEGSGPFASGEVRFKQEPPEELGRVQRVAEARKKPEGLALTRALSSFFG